jgi:enoyl-CoA hydratase/carnithine racemase
MPGLSFGLVLGTRRYATRVGLSRARNVLGRGLSFDADEALRDGFLTDLSPRDDWSDVLAEEARNVTLLSTQAAAALDRATVVDTRAADLADLVQSAARPGLKERIRIYRA